MKPFILVTAIFTLSAGFASAAAAEWKQSLDLSLAMAQSSYNSHWIGGEAGSVNWISKADLSLTGRFSGGFAWENQLKLSFGQTHIQDQETKTWQKPEKSADRIFLESVGRINLGLAIDPYLAATFESQFLDASLPQVKRYVNPFILTESIGVSRVLADTSYVKFVSRAGVAVRHYSDKAVVDTAAGITQRETETSAGLEWVTDFMHTYAEEKMKYETKLRTYVAFTRSGAGGSEGDDWKVPHVAWEHTLSAAVTEVIQVSLFIELLYDKEVSEAVRFKEVLALGLTYKMF